MYSFQQAIIPNVIEFLRLDDFNISFCHDVTNQEMANTLIFANRNSKNIFLKMKSDKKKMEDLNQIDETTAVENTTEQPTEIDQNTAKIDPIEELKKELTSAKDQNLRLYAEFENFRRRNAKERLELMATANNDMMQAILPVVDDFERAMKNISKTEENKALYEGVELIYNKLVDTLKNKGLKPMESTVGQPFDLEKMEAITRIPAPQPELHNQVLDEVERGYQLGEKVIRYAKVVVGHHEE